MLYILVMFALLGTVNAIIYAYLWQNLYRNEFLCN